MMAGLDKAAVTRYTVSDGRIISDEGEEEGGRFAENHNNQVQSGHHMEADIMKHIDFVRNYNILHDADHPVKRHHHIYFN